LVLHALAKIPRSAWLMLGIFLAVFIIPLGFQVPGQGRLVDAIQNAGHTLLFALASFLLVVKGWGRPGWVVLGLATIGIAIEVVQPWIGRDGNWQDGLMDLLGIAVGFCLGMRPWRAWRLLLGLSLLTLALNQPLQLAWAIALQWQRFPLLADFESGSGMLLVDYYEGASAEPMAAPEAYPGNRSQVLQAHFPGSGWPGVVLVDVPPDWRGFEALELEVWLPPDTQLQELRLALRAQRNLENQHDLSRRFAVQPGLNHLRWPLQEMTEPITPTLLEEVGRVVVFAAPNLANPKASREAYLDNFRLVRPSH
jgi:VanZ family protein